MAYEEGGRSVRQQGKNGAAFVIIVDENGTPVAAGGSTDLTPLTSLYGTVTTNPAANTLLARLKDITQAIYAPKYTYVTITQVTTSATGTPFVAFGSLGCEILEVVNDTGTDLEYKRGGTGLTMVIPNGQTKRILGLTNANTIGFKRKDSATTQVIVRAEAIKI